jgi:hypothetical protein
MQEEISVGMESEAEYEEEMEEYEAEVEEMSGFILTSSASLVEWLEMNEYPAEVITLLQDFTVQQIAYASVDALVELGIPKATAEEIYESADYLASQHRA